MKNNKAKVIKVKEGFLMSPKVDWAFKEIMTNGQARIGFLSAVLGIKPEDIKETKLLNTDLKRKHEDDKQGILDVRILMNDDTETDVEIQLAELKVWADRALFYLSKIYTDQISPGQDYVVFKKCVSISILDFNLFRGEKEFYSRFHIREDTRGFIYTDKMEFHVIELVKLPKELKEDCSNVELWARFINADKKEEFDMLAQKDKYISSAYEHLQEMSQDKQKRMEYEARQKAIWDYNQMMREAEERGREKGKEEASKEAAEAQKEAAEAQKEAAEARKEAAEAWKETTEARKAAAEAQRQAREAQKRAEEAEKKLQSLLR